MASKAWEEKQDLFTRCRNEAHAILASEAQELRAPDALVKELQAASDMFNQEQTLREKARERTMALFVRHEDVLNLVDRVAAAEPVHLNGSPCADTAPESHTFVPADLAYRITCRVCRAYYAMHDNGDSLGASEPTEFTKRYLAAKQTKGKKP